MAVSGAILINLVLALALVPTLTTSEVIVVGGEQGWNTGVDYSVWAEGKTFTVGDTLVFNYDPNWHNVNKVGQAGFAKCQTIPELPPMSSGHDVIELKSAGSRWYICSVSDHCESGQKLFINVMPASKAPAPAPASWYAPTPRAAQKPWVAPSPWSASTTATATATGPALAPAPAQDGKMSN